jgi:hypothetical protein
VPKQRFGALGTVVFSALFLKKCLQCSIDRGMIFQHSARRVDFLSVPDWVGRGDEAAGGNN